MGFGIATDKCGNVYVTGTFVGIATFGSTSLTSFAAEGIFVSKLDTNGTWLWAVKAIGVGSAAIKALGIATDCCGNVYITGFFATTITFGSIMLSPFGGSDIFVAKLDTSGTWLWAVQAGGTSDDVGNAIAIDQCGNVYVTGFFSSTATFGTITLTSVGSRDIFVAKLDTNSIWLWAKKAGGTNSDQGLGIATDQCGNVYVTGKFRGTATFETFTLISFGSDDIFVAKLDTTGIWLWTEKAGGTGFDEGRGIATDQCGNVYVAGNFRDTSTFGSTTFTLFGDSDIFISKLDTNGNWLWTVQAGGNKSDLGLGIATDQCGNVYVTGNFSEIATFGSTTLTSFGLEEEGELNETDIFVSKLDTDSNWLWTVKAGGVEFDRGHGIATDQCGNIYVTGQFNEPNATFETTTVTSAGGDDVFVAKYTNFSKFFPVALLESNSQGQFTKFEHNRGVQVPCYTDLIPGCRYYLDREHDTVSDKNIVTARFDPKKCCCKCCCTNKCCPNKCCSNKCCHRLCVGISLH